ncbi:MAG: MMPL family transporter [Chloroflexota bacterium]|nr:MMPL family transporter [Chloroflexota bacterium]
MRIQRSSGGSPELGFLDKVASFVQNRSSLVIITLLVLTVLLVLPIVFMSPTETASDHPGGEVFDIRAMKEEILPPAVHYIVFVVESKDGDILTQEELWELYQNEETLRESDAVSELLYSYYHIESDTVALGIYTIADAVYEYFEEHPEYGVTLSDATDDQVKIAIDHVMGDPNASYWLEYLSVDASHESRDILGQPIEYWQCSAMLIEVDADNSKLPEEITPGVSAGTAGGPEHQRFNRDVQSLLRGDQQSYELWGVAIDLTLEADEEGMLSIPLIITAMVIILIIMSIHFRSVHITFLTVIGLIMLIVWLKGLSNLIGLKSSLTLDIIVPIAILVLGIDYAIHSIHRYIEERDKGYDPKVTITRSISGVGGALILAASTTMVAFGSNISAGTEEIREFGVAGTLAILISLIIMGVLIPLLKMRRDIRFPGKPSASSSLGGTREVRHKSDGWHIAPTSSMALPPIRERSYRGERLGRIVCSVVDRKAVVLPLIIVLSIVAFYYAGRLESSMDAKDYLSGSSDFVVSLDKLDEHIGDKGGEIATIYIEGDLTAPESLDAIQSVVDNLNDDQSIARNPSDGNPYVYNDLFDFLDTVLSSDVAIARIEAFNPGISITDDDSNGIPDTSEQLVAVYDYIVQYGIPLDEEVVAYDVNQVKEGLFHDPLGEQEDATQLLVFLPGTREQAVLKDSMVELTEDMNPLEVSSISTYGLTGAPYERDAALDAITTSLMYSIIVAIVLCLLVLLVAFRSFKYAIATIIPVILVAIWLHGIMYLAGFHLNAVTATIAAISIGVGIDYSVHIAARFRQELRIMSDKREAVEQAASKSGYALLGAATSTMLGFLVMGFAPMPMFASFGILTALMILMAFVAALFVLPSLLVLVAARED